jgi:hypothetical protein
MSKGVINVNEQCSFPNGYTITDNRIEDYLQKLLSPSAYVIWRQYLRFWGGDKSSAYPSLATISNRTGLSEKTIRRCNKELVKIGFMTYIPGNSKRANQYYYVPIGDLMKRFYGTELPETDKTNADKQSFIKEKDSKTEDKIRKKLEELNDYDKASSLEFIRIFKDAYKDKMGIEYGLEYSDVNTLTSNIDDVSNNFILYTGLVHRMFKTDNKFIVNSDYSMHFLFVPKVKKALIAEYYQTNFGRWLAQADRKFEKLKEEFDKEIKDKKITGEEDIKTFVDKNIDFGSGNSERDKFVYDNIIEKLRDHFLK